MKKTLLPVVLFLLTLCVPHLSAQKIMGVGQLGLGVPMGDFSDRYGAAFSIVAQGRYQVEEKFWLTGQLGYQLFSRKNTTLQGSVPVEYSGSASVLPIAIGGILEVGEGNFLPYVSGELGLFFLGQTLKTTQLGVTKETSTSRQEFGLIPGVGFLYPLNEKLTLDIALKYHWIFGNALNDVTDTQFFSINAGVVFPLN